jgi:hypothetical protein
MGQYASTHYYKQQAYTLYYTDWPQTIKGWFGYRDPPPSFTYYDLPEDDNFDPTPPSNSFHGHFR